MVAPMNGGQAAQVMANVAAAFVAIPQGPRAQPRRAVDARRVDGIYPGRSDL